MKPRIKLSADGWRFAIRFRNPEDEGSEQRRVAWCGPYDRADLAILSAKCLRLVNE